ncbi:MAG: hypothetical protein IJ724_05505 [Muribaculaceae bacterium]|nr:hypothetical protein [Muribaculaceae bacterium]MBR1474026.1 hypothetical protein [Muribaculaceae bacterium]MBR1726091.1 hypothetical protein [Muribaculaceae bacterium]
MDRKHLDSRPDYIRWMLAAGAAAAIAALVVLFVKREHFFHSVPKFNLADYPVRGIDVSNHNGTIDWMLVAQADYQFAYVKASEGKTHRDTAFERNVKSARKAGLRVGAYHFFRKSRDGVEQANNLLGAVAGVELDLPLVVDIEDWDNDSWQDDKVVQQRFRDMVNALLKAGHRVMIYTNGDGYGKFYRPNFPDMDLWLCSFRSPDVLRDTHRHRIQQYSHWGEVSGVDGDVDLNVFMGSQHEWDTWVDAIRN